MLENTNDYLSIIAVILLLIFTFAMALNLFNLKVVKKNVQKEINYYGFDRNNLTKKSGKK